MSDAKKLSDRIGDTTVIIDAVAEEMRRADAGLVVRLAYTGKNYSIPRAFAGTTLKAIHAVLMQARAVDAIHLAQAAGVPAVSEGMEDDLSVVVLAPRALVGPDKEPEGD